MNREMKCVGFLCLLVLLNFEAARGQAAEVWSSTAAIIDRVTPDLMKEHHTPGVSVALLDAGRIVWTGCYGVKSADSPAPVTDDSVFEACSMSKPLFAYAFLNLVEQERFHLDRPLTEYLPAPYLEHQPLHTQITARMVLAHTTGFPNWRKGGWRNAGILPVRFVPGSRFGYSGEGFWYLQQVVEHVVKEPLDTWSQRVILQPLKMNNSSYVWRKDFDLLAASGHGADGKVKPNRRHFDRANTAFTLYTTPTDYALFLIEVMNPDRRAKHSLSAEMIRDMLNPAVKTESPEVWRSLGWAVTKREESVSIGHSGANGTGFRCVCEFNPSTSRGIVIMTNAIGGKEAWRSILKSIRWLSAEEEHER